MTEKNKKGFFGKNKAYIYILIVISLFIISFFYIKSFFDINNKEKAAIEKAKRDREIAIAKKKKIIENRKNKEKELDKEYLKYPEINSRGAIRFKEFEVSKKELKEKEEDDIFSKSYNKDGDVVMFEVYNKIFENGYSGLSFDKVISEYSYDDNGYILNLYLKGNYESSDSVTDLLFIKVLEKAAFQFNYNKALKIFVNGKIFDKCFFDSRGCVENNKYAISKNRYFENSKKRGNNFIFDLVNKDEVDYKKIEIRGVVFEDSEQFLPFEGFVGGAKVYNSEGVFLGEIPIKKVSDKNKILNNKKIIRYINNKNSQEIVGNSKKEQKLKSDLKSSGSEKSSKETQDMKPKVVDKVKEVRKEANEFEKVSAISVFGSGSVAEPRTKEGYIVITPDDDTLESPAKIKINVIFK